MNINDCYNFEDFRKLAKKKLPAPIFHYIDGGADEICFLDITASNENRETIYDVVKDTSKKCFAEVESLICISSSNNSFILSTAVKPPCI